MVIDRLTGLPVILHNDPLVERFVAHLKDNGGNASLYAFEVGAIMHASEPTSRQALGRLVDHGYVRVEPGTKGKRLYTLTIDRLRACTPANAA